MILRMEVPVSIQLQSGSSTRKKVAISVEEKTNARQTNEKQLHVRITDPEDPQFLFSLILNESDFQTLRTQQGLLVDFNSFSGMVQQLLQKCLDESQSECPKFNLVLSNNNETSGNHGGILSFEEVNPFRRLCHLSLKVCRGSDAQIKDYLSECLQRLQRNHQAMESSLSGKVQQLETDLELVRRKLAETTNELNETSKKVEIERSNVNVKLSQELAREKEKCTKELGEMQIRHESDRRQLTDNHMRTVRNMENRIASLDYENKDLSEKRHRHEATIQRLNDKLKLQEEDLNRLRLEVSSKRTESHKLDSDFAKKEKTIGQLQTRLALVEQDNSRLQNELQNLQGKFNVLQEQKIRQNQELSEKTSLVARRETAVKNISHELLKANEIIKKFQDQVKSEHFKVKHGLKLIEENDKIVESKDKELSAMREEVKNMSENLRETSTEKKELNSKLESIQNEMSSLQKKLTTNETVINWLNKQLTKAQARDPGLRLAAPPDGIRTFTPSGMAAFSTPFDPQSARPKTTGRSKNNSHEESVHLKSNAVIAQKENTNQRGLDSKYFETPGGESTKPLKPKNSVLPCNVRGRGGSSLRGGLMRKSSNNSPNTQNQNVQSLANEIDSVYFPKT